MPQVPFVSQIVGIPLKAFVFLFRNLTYIPNPGLIVPSGEFPELEVSPFSLPLIRCAASLALARV